MIDIREHGGIFGGGGKKEGVIKVPYPVMSLETANIGIMNKVYIHKRDNDNLISYSVDGRNSFGEQNVHIAEADKNGIRLWYKKFIMRAGILDTGNFSFYFIDEYLYLRHYNTTWNKEDDYSSIIRVRYQNLRDIEAVVYITKEIELLKNGKMMNISNTGKTEFPYVILVVNSSGERAVEFYNKNLEFVKKYPFLPTVLESIYDKENDKMYMIEGNYIRVINNVSSESSVSYSSILFDESTVARNLGVNKTHIMVSNDSQSSSSKVMTINRRSVSDTKKVTANIFVYSPSVYENYEGFLGVGYNASAGVASKDLEHFIAFRYVDNRQILGSSVSIGKNELKIFDGAFYGTKEVTF